MAWREHPGLSASVGRSRQRARPASFTPLREPFGPDLFHEFREATYGVLTRRESPLPNGPALLLPLSYARRLHRFADPPVLQIETVVRKATASPFGQERRGTLEALAHRLDVS